MQLVDVLRQFRVAGWRIESRTLLPGVAVSYALAIGRDGTLYAALRDETLACYAAAGLNRPSDDERAERWSVLSSKPIPGRPRGAGSGWQSMVRQTGNVETDYVNGEVVLLGRLHGVPTPVNDALRRLSNWTGSNTCW